MGAAAQLPDEDVVDRGGGIDFPPSGGFGEQDGRVVAGPLCVGEIGGQDWPAGLGEDLLGQRRQCLADEGCLPLLHRDGQAETALVDHGQGLDGGGSVGGV
ncbi:hypothetical protein [Streptomyces sp. NPDC056304]|uniref:hypothetical protein n=1 Tax=Streptomyces sp. NPDC056304 TaxID=3345778 RepID=UPI0035E20710